MTKGVAGRGILKIINGGVSKGAENEELFPRIRDVQDGGNERASFEWDLNYLSGDETE